jgi:hypothetical protein
MTVERVEARANEPPVAIPELDTHEPELAIACRRALDGARVAHNFEQRVRKLQALERPVTELYEFARQAEEPVFDLAPG